MLKLFLLAATAVVVGSACYSQEKIPNNLNLVRLVEAAHVGDLERVIELIDRGTSLNETVPPDLHQHFSNKMNGYPGPLACATPLKAALSARQDIVAAYLLGGGAKCRDAYEEPLGHSELYLLIASRKKEGRNLPALATLLLAAGADPTQKIRKVITIERGRLLGKSILEICELYGHTETANLLRQSQNKGHEK